MRVLRALSPAAIVGAALCLSHPLAAQAPAGYGPSAAWQPHLSAQLAPPAASPLGAPTIAPGARILQDDRPHTGPAVALMIVGVAGIVTGLLVDENVVTVAGAVAAGVGLYLYLR